LINGLMPYGSTITSLVLSSPVVHRPIGSMERDNKETKERGARTAAARVGA
jgi:hypothetical protein